MGAEPEGLSRLTRFAERVPAGVLIYDQGDVPQRIVVVLRGYLQFEVVGDDGAVSVVGGAGPGHLAGHVAAVNARPTSAAARTSEETILLSIPLDALAEAFQDAPGLAVTLAAALEVSLRDGQAAREAFLIPVSRPVDDQFFFVDDTDCPVCDAAFEYLRIRTRSVRPTQRDSDLHVGYTTIDPTWYALVVCPRCFFTSYRDDFGALEAEERERLVAAADERRALAPGPLTGPRSVEDAEIALGLAMRCYALRHPNERRRAVLLHRRAWLARGKGDTGAEMEWLARARDAYQDAYERDPDVSDEGALHAAYLIGDLTLRLGNPRGASRWLEVCLKGVVGDQSGLVRMARERLHDAREALNALAGTAQGES